MIDKTENNVSLLTEQEAMVTTLAVRYTGRQLFEACILNSWMNKTSKTMFDLMGVEAGKTVLRIIHKTEQHHENDIEDGRA